MHRRLLSIAAVLVLASSGCGQQLSVSFRQRPSPSPLSGIWGLVERTTDTSADQRIDRHELQLERRGAHVIGFWYRSRTWHSADGRPYACNRKPVYEHKLRSLLQGRLGHDAHQADVRLVFHRQEQPRPECPVMEIPPADCQLRRQGEQLIARCGKQRLVFEPRLGSPVPLALALGPPGTVTGVWTWHHRSEDARSDLKTEDELWHLVQRGDVIEGYYERYVAVRSRDGRRFVCNNGLAYGNLARFRLQGKVVGRELVLREIEYSTRPGSCETGRRVLDEYRGMLSHDGSMIELRWDKGAQLLRRRY